MKNFFKNLFGNKNKENTSQLSLKAHPIEINLSNTSQKAIERNNARLGRLKEAIAKGQGTPEIERELVAREKFLESLRESLK